MFEYIKRASILMNAEEMFLRLGMIHRYGGLGESVAAHSHRCALFAEEHGLTARTQLFCLLHDCEEAMLGDIPSPLKDLLPSDAQSSINAIRREMVFRYTGLGPTLAEWHDVFYCDGAIAKIEHIGKRVKVEHDIESALRCHRLFEQLMDVCVLL